MIGCKAQLKIAENCIFNLTSETTNYNNFNVRNVQKFGYCSNYSVSSWKKIKIAVPFITLCWIIENQKIKSQFFSR